MSKTKTGFVYCSTIAFAAEVYLLAYVNAVCVKYAMKAPTITSFLKEIFKLRL